MKQIQLIDLCSRVPYHPKGHVVNALNCAECDEWLTCATFPMFTSITNNSRLYLRPMSSMTEEEKIEYRNLHHTEKWEHVNKVLEFDVVYSRDIPLYIDWLNAHHFDYRGLIPMGIALEAPEGMYNIK